MDDFNISTLHESKNEWASRLITIMTPMIITGFKSILDESIKLCKENNEHDKYLMTFQNLVSRIPKWNTQIIETERKRICDKSGCNYLEELITCVHIIQLKILTSMRVGQKQKKIDINIPKMDDFIHKTYINVARKVYKNVYLFEVGIQPLQIQKNYREIEIIVQECILNTVRESIPVEAILKAYMDETVEEDVVEEVSEKITEEPIKAKMVDPVAANDKQFVSSKLKFDDVDYMQATDGNVSNVNAPKSLDRLEEISEMRNTQRKMDEEEEEDRDKIHISMESFNLDAMDIHNIEEPQIDLLPDLLMDEIEILN